MRRHFDRPPVTVDPEPTWWAGDALILLLAVGAALLAVVLGAPGVPSLPPVSEALRADVAELSVPMHAVTLVMPLSHAAPDLPTPPGLLLADAAHAALPPAPEPPQAAFLDATALDALDPVINVIADDQAIRFRIASDTLFATAGSSLTPAGQAALQPLVAVLQGYDTPVTIEGHADSIPIRSQRYPSNWELSTSRAVSVLRYLEGKGVAGTRLHASGYAHTRPIAGNGTPAGRAENRRIDIVVALPPHPSTHLSPHLPATNNVSATTKPPIMQTFPRLQSARHDFRSLQSPASRPA